MKTFLFAIILTVTSVTAAQTLSPLNNECGKRCSGQYTITNNGLQPLTVTVTPVQFVFDSDGKPSFRDLEPDTEIRMNSMSARLQPKEVYTFDYHVKCVKMPCAVAFANSMLQGKVNNDGINMKIVLVEALYVCEKQKNCRMSYIPKNGVK